MRKNLVSIVALLLVLATALPAFALDVTYGGLFRARLQSNDNIVYGTDGGEFLNDDLGIYLDDNQNYIDQRIRFYMNFIASQNLKMVLAFEQDTLWGGNQKLRDSAGDLETLTPKVLTGHRDTVGLELKNAYVDFAIPCTPTRAKVGLQPLAIMNGWIVDEDFTGAITVTDFSPVKVTLGYISEGNNSVTDSQDNIDDLVFAVNYAQGPLTAEFNMLFQYAHDQSDYYGGGGTAAFNVTPGMSYTAKLINAYYGAGIPTTLPSYNDDQLFDLGLSVGYKLDWMNATLNYIQNLGSAEDGLGNSHDYRGFMVELITNFYSGPFTFTLGGFYTSGQDWEDSVNDLEGSDFNAFVYPVGASHYWSEIMGLGSLENTSNGSAVLGDQIVTGDYVAGDHPSNLWTINAGAAWQAMPKTKLTFNYYYIGTSQDAVSEVTEAIEDLNLDEIKYSNEVGHEFDLYIDQEIVDKLMLRLVAAYLVAGDAYTVLPDDDNAYELGARLQWSF